MTFQCFLSLSQRLEHKRKWTVLLVEWRPIYEHFLILLPLLLKPLNFLHIHRLQEPLQLISEAVIKHDAELSVVDILLPRMLCLLGQEDWNTSCPDRRRQKKNTGSKAINVQLGTFLELVLPSQFSATSIPYLNKELPIHGQSNPQPLEVLRRISCYEGRSCTPLESRDDRVHASPDVCSFSCPSKSFLFLAFSSQSRAFPQSRSCTAAWSSWGFH
mmetsp:Transcript_28886/g.112518  ORF Transcript_28886/g.112518 Transcript_28886/m.112518 type:complete len:216 (-) Transcript_28886:1442-2089(-)